jgi:toxin FitB
VIVLDTNVISELMRPVPDARVTTWLDAQDPLSLYTTTITVAEIQQGIHCLPKGKRRSNLEQGFERFVAAAFPGRLLGLDQQAANACGRVSQLREQKGLHADMVDMLIAAIVTTAQASLATRNISDFEACGLKLINPWDA